MDGSAHEVIFPSCHEASDVLSRVAVSYLLHVADWPRAGGRVSSCSPSKSKGKCHVDRSMEECVEVSDVSSEVPDDPEEPEPIESFLEVHGAGCDPSIDPVPGLDLTGIRGRDSMPAQFSEPTVSVREWDAIISSGYGRFRQPVPELAYPWRLAF